MDCCQNKTSVFARLKIMTAGQKERIAEGLKTRKVALIGNPNVGKSVIFNSLTGVYVTVSNYPGTTVEVSRGWLSTEGTRLEIIDTPGMYSMVPITEEERVTRNLLLQERPDLVVHVVDAKNIERMLPLTLQLMECGLEVILVLNIMDEARALGVEIDCHKLQAMLGIPVLTASAAANEGMDEIRRRIGEKVNHAA